MQQIALPLYPVEQLPDKLTRVIGEHIYHHRILKPKLSKYDLRLTFNCVDNRALYRTVLTDEVLERVGCSRADILLLREFDIVLSSRIYQALNLRWIKTTEKI